MSWDTVGALAAAGVLFRWRSCAVPVVAVVYVVLPAVLLGLKAMAAVVVVFFVAVMLVVVYVVVAQ